jgi:hypothetical protein
MAGSSDAQALLLQVSADTSKALKQLDELSKKLSGVAGDAEKASKRASTSLEKFFGKTDPAKALDKVFDSTRFRVLDSGVAKVGIFGSALESLGPAGLAAAAGVGAVAAAFAGARQAAAFADDISDTANRLHVTTDALQEYRYAIRTAGGDEKGADEALEAFNVTLGKAQAGLPKALKAFKELGFTPDQVKGFTDADTALKAVVDRIAGLSDVQKDAVISQLGLDGIKPLIEDGVDAMQRLRDEAHKVGVVMDADLVKRGGELNDQFETVAKVIDIQLKSALVDLGPILLGLIKLMADMARAAADVVDAFRSIENKTDRGLDNKALQLSKEILILKRSQAQGQGVSQLAIDNKVAELNAVEAQRQERKANRAPAPVTPTRTLIDQGGGGINRTPKSASAPRDTTADRTAAVNEAIASATRDRLQAEGALTDDIEARAEIERKIGAQELASALTRIKKLQDDIDADKGIADPAVKTKLKQALEDQAKVEAEKAAQARIDLINREADWAKEDQADETRKLIRDAEITTLEAAAAVATTATERTKIEAEILRLKQLERDHELGKQLSRQVETGQITQDVADQRFNAGRSANASERQEFDVAHENPIQRFQREVQDFATIAQNAGVNAMESLSTGLADAIVNAHSLGDVAKNVFRQMVADLLAAAIKKDIVAPLLAFIPGFASGTNSAPGGLALVGERGPELVNLPKGSKVTPSHQTLQALQSMQIPKAASPIIVQQSLMFDNRGAVMTDDLLLQMNAMAAGAQQRAVAQSLALGKKQLPDVLRSHQMLRG